MPNFRNLKELERYMNQKILASSMKNVGEAVADKLKKQIDEDVYSYDHKMYERTEQLRDSVISETYIQSNEMVVSEIGHDSSKMIPNAKKHQHTSVWGDNVAEWLPEWINNGEIGSAFGYGEWTEKRPYMDNMKDKIENENIFKNELKKELRKHGIKTD